LAILLLLVEAECSVAGKLALISKPALRAAWSMAEGSLPDNSLAAPQTVVERLPVRQ